MPNTLTNAEIVNKYRVSKATVTRWTKLGEAGKYNLEVLQSNGKVRVLDTPQNRIQMQILAEKGRIYKPNSPTKEVSLPDRFYEIFTKDEVLEIYDDLANKKQINLKYNYKSEGATHWDNLYKSNLSGIEDSGKQMLSNGLPSVLYFVGQNKINFFDIGSGNAMPTKDLLHELNKKGALNKYISIDISREINSLSINNVKTWFKGMDTKDYILDIEHANFVPVFVENSQDRVNNILFFVGNTLCNFDDRIFALKNLAKGLSKNDLLIFSFTLDTLENRSSINYVKSEPAELHGSWLLNLLGFDVEKCSIITKYDEVLNAKIKTLILDKNYIINFRSGDKILTLRLDQGEELKRWKHFLLSQKQFYEEVALSGLKLVGLHLDKNENNALAICRVK